jgi:DNA-binding IclR family transcriptional regulator
MTKPASSKHSPVAGRRARRTDGEAPINQSIERAARLLGLFSIDEPKLPLSQLSARLGTSKATTYRYASALRRSGLLRASPRGYALGPRVVELASIALAGLHVVAVSSPFLERLVMTLNETAVLSVWDGEAPVVVRSLDNTDRIVHIGVRTGTRLTPESAQAQIFRAFLQPDDHDPDLEQIRRDRVCYRAGIVDAIAVLAAPVLQRDAIVATMALVGTVGTIPEGPHSKMAVQLRDTAAALSAELG